MERVVILHDTRRDEIRSASMLDIGPLLREALPDDIGMTAIRDADLVLIVSEGTGPKPGFVMKDRNGDKRDIEVVEVTI